MSIIYNNQVVAGKYTQQVVADADTVNAGIIKLATEEQIIEGVDNTTAVTPFYLAQKQDKISAGDGIVIDNNEISCTINPDEQTIVRKDNGTMQCIGQLTKSNTLKFDWEGTQDEYNVAYLNGTIQPDWYCYITDDEEFVDYGDVCNQSLSNLKPEGEARFDEKLDKNQITNCLLEVPQNIKLELNNGVLTLKAGSKVIVPNGVGIFEDVDVASDITLGDISLTIENLVLFITPNGKGFGYRPLTHCFSGTSDSGTKGTNYYNISTNIITSHNNGGDSQVTLPIAIVDVVSGVGVTAIKQVFNGMGYIGSTIWVDKGVKLLFPNGRHEDGSLNNIEGSTQVVKLYTAPNTYTHPSAQLVLDSENGIKPNTVGIACNSYIEVDEIPTSRILNNVWLLHRPSNLVYQWNGTTSKYELKSASLVVVADASISAGVITSFQPKQPFRAVDYNDYRTEVDSKVSKSGDTMTGDLTISTNATSELYLQSTNFDYTSTTAPSSATAVGSVVALDKNKKTTGCFQNIVNTAGSYITQIYARRSVGGTEKNGVMAVGIKTDGTIFTQAPTPPTGDNSTQIATTAWVQANNAFPSNRYIDLTFGASNTSYTAPANGWFAVNTWSTATATSYIHLYNTSNELAILLVPNQGSGYQQKCFIPAKKGDVVKLIYGNLDTSRSYFRFIYAEGEVS